MKLHCIKFLLSFVFIAFTNTSGQPVQLQMSYGQNDLSVQLNIGSPAPALQVREWLKGRPVREFEKGKVYVVEFWATWCGPCIEEMPRLSDIARKYKGKVTVISVNIYERKKLLAVKAFIDSMVDRIDYAVAVQDSNFMEANWMNASEESAIPTCFVIDAQGEIAWIGFTANLLEPLSKIVENDWNIKQALAERNANKPLEKMGREAFEKLVKYNDNRYMTNFFGEPDSALLYINKIVLDNPGMKFEYFISFSTLHALLRKDPHKACEYGRAMMSSKYPSYNAIIETLKEFPYQYNTLPAEIFELGAEACQAEIDLNPWTTKSPENYLRMAEWYLRGKNKTKAKQAMRNAIRALKRKKTKFVQRPF